METIKYYPCRRYFKMTNGGKFVGDFDYIEYDPDTGGKWEICVGLTIGKNKEGLFHWTMLNYGSKMVLGKNFFLGKIYEILSM